MNSYLVLMPLGLFTAFFGFRTSQIARLADHFNLTVLKYAFLSSFDVLVTIWQRWLCNLIPSNKRFDNQTSLQMSDLEETWKNAQEELATKPFPLDVFTGDQQLHDPDPRARAVDPKNVTVLEKKDVPIAELVKLDPRWAKHTDPSQTLLVFGNSNSIYCHSYVSMYRKPRVYAVSSEVKACLNYEFQNIILNRLGYNTNMR